MGLFSKVPSISVSAFGGKRSPSSVSLDRTTSMESAGSAKTESDSSSSDEEGAEGGKSRSRSGKRHRRWSHLFHRSRSPSPGDSVLQGIRRSNIDRMPRTISMESDTDSVVDITPNNAFTSDGEDENPTPDEDGEEMPPHQDLTLSWEEYLQWQKEEEEKELYDPDDPDYKAIKANTQANTSKLSPLEYLQSEDQPAPFQGQAPNILTPPTASNPFHSTLGRRRSTKSGPGGQQMALEVSRPVYERNRCTITVEHGNQEQAAKEARRTRLYFVASDLSQESMYSLEWCIGTVLRQGDECLFMTVMETETKFDPAEGDGGDKMAKIRNQKDRQEKAALLAREATALLIRTKLNVKVTCQAVHAKNARHILVDCIDWLQPDLVIVGSRGLSSLKGTLMGSVSNYLVQKSSVPVMVARRRLRAPPRVYKKRQDLDRSARVPLDQAAIEKESHNQQTTVNDDEEGEKKEGEEGQEKERDQDGKADDTNSESSDDDQPSPASPAPGKAPGPPHASGAMAPADPSTVLARSTTPDTPAPAAPAPVPAPSLSVSAPASEAAAPSGTAAKDPAVAEKDNSPPP